MKYAAGYPNKTAKKPDRKAIFDEFKSIFRYVNSTTLE
jgi:hypothetical protein